MRNVRLYRGDCVDTKTIKWKQHINGPGGRNGHCAKAFDQYEYSEGEDSGNKAEFEKTSKKKVEVESKKKLIIKS